MKTYGGLLSKYRTCKFGLAPLLVLYDDDLDGMGIWDVMMQLQQQQLGPPL